MSMITAFSTTAAMPLANIDTQMSLKFNCETFLPKCECKEMIWLSGRIGQIQGTDSFV